MPPELSKTVTASFKPFTTCGAYEFLNTLLFHEKYLKLMFIFIIKAYIEKCKWKSGSFFHKLLYLITAVMVNDLS